MINIGICGQVSSGKTTALNALIGNYVGETKMSRATMRICSFIHSCSSEGYEDIEKNIKDVNSNKSENSVFKINISLSNKPDCDYSIHDFPGFNDGKEDIDGMETLFYNKLHELDYVIYLIDSTCPLVLKSEKDLVQNIINKINYNINNRNKYTRIIFVFNKFDDDEDDEIVEMIDDAKEWIGKTLKDNNYTCDCWYFNVSFRNMMIRRIFEKTKNKKDAFKFIPKLILKRALSDVYGKYTASRIIKNKKISKKQLKHIELSDDENNLLKLLKKCVSKEFNVKHIKNMFEEKIKKIVDNIGRGYICGQKEYLTCIYSHRYLRELDYMSFYNIFKYSINVIEDKSLKFEDNVVSINNLEDLLALHKYYVIDFDYSGYIYSYFEKYLENHDAFGREYMIYAFTKLLNNPCKNWIKLFKNMKRYPTSEYELNTYMKIKRRKKNIDDNTGFILIGDEIIFSELFHENTYEVISKTNDVDVITSFIEKMDIVLYEMSSCHIMKCSTMFNDNSNTGWTSASWMNSPAFLKELFFESIVRIDYSYIYANYSDSSVKYRTSSLINTNGFDLLKYDKWSMKYTKNWEPDITELDSYLCRVLPSHVMNHIYMKQMLKFNNLLNISDKKTIGLSETIDNESEDGSEDGSDNGNDSGSYIEYTEGSSELDDSGCESDGTDDSDEESDKLKKD